VTTASRRPQLWQGSPDHGTSGSSLRPSIGLWLALAIIGLVATIAYRTTAEQVENTVWVEHTYQVLVTLDELGGALAGMENARRGFGLTVDDEQVAAFTTAANRLEVARATVRSLTSDNLNQTQRIDRLAPLFARTRSIQEAAIDWRRRDGFVLGHEVSVIRDVKGVVEQIVTLLSDMTSEERRLLVAREERMTRSAAQAKVAHVLGTGVSVPILLFAFAGLRRENARRARSERAARASEQNLAMTLRCIGDGVIATDAGGRIVSTNAAAEELTGWGGGAVGELLSEVFRVAPGDAHEEGEQDVFRRLLRDEPASVAAASHRVLVRKDGRNLAVTESAASIRDAQGTVTGVVLVFRDVTRERDAARRLAESEDRLARLAEALPFGVLVFDVQSDVLGDAHIVYANSQASVESRLDVRAFVGKTLKDAMPDDFADGRERAFAAALRRAVDTGGHEIVEVDRGARGLVECHYVSLGGRGAAVIYNNVTEKRKAETALREREARFRELADAMPQIVWTAKADGSLDYFNRRSFEYTGTTPEETCERGWASLMHPDDRQASLERWTKALETGGAHDGRYRLKRASDGSYRWHLGRAVPIRDPKGEIAKWIGTSTDIDDQVRADEALRRNELAMRDAAARTKADERFRALLETAPDASVIVDAGGKIVLINAQTERLFGYDRRELQGQPVEMLLPERVRSKHAPLRASYFSNASLRAMGAGLELQGLRKDGVEFPIEVSLGPLETDDGTFVSSAIRDISARKQTEERLRASDESLRLLIGGVKDYAILMLDPNGLVTTWNAGAERVKGFASHDVIGRHFSMFYPPEDVRDGKPEMHLRVAATEGRYEDDGWRVRKDGSRFLANVVITAVSDGSGKLIGFAKVTRDVTERHVAQSALELSNRELEAFSYSVAHDLRAPLRGMNGFAQVLLNVYKDKLDAEGQDWLREILSNARKMGDLIDALLSLAQVARSEISPERVDLSAVARAAAAELAAGEPGRTVEILIQADLAADVDARLARTIFDNLLGNAWKFTRRMPVARVEVGITGDDGPPAFFVRDNGAGFDMAFKDKLFSPFQRLHTVDEFPGTGVGLSTVQRIVQRHNGRIWAEGRVGDGATFHFTLPGKRS
jgi:PAS domain S-box-containing protein